MDCSEGRPQPRAQQVEGSLSHEILLELLEVERARLKEALRIEKERKIVFPETTVIIKDIERLLSLIEGKREAQPVSGDINELLESLRGG